MPRATTDHHPATRRGPRRPPPTPARWPTGRMIPRDQDEVLVALGDRRVKLTNLRKLFWPALGFTKGDLIRYYVDVAPVLLPHLRDRAMVMRRYPDGAGGKSFFMKRAPTPRPDWLATCAIEHASGNVIDFPMIQDLAALLWVVNLGCIDLNQWYARCDDVDRPDYLHFDLDPTEGATFAQVLKTARILHATPARRRSPGRRSSTGSRSTTSASTTCRRASSDATTCGRRCWRRRGGSICGGSVERAPPLSLDMFRSEVLNEVSIETTRAR